MQPRQNSLSATNLAVYHHLNCDLYLHNVYHRAKSQTSASASPENVLLESHYKRGNDWEAALFQWLDDTNLLLKVPSTPLEATTLKENILADDRELFYIAGLSFWPPQTQLGSRFARYGTDPVTFGLGKPDLLAIHRTTTGVRWKVIDAKASSSIKTAHHMQIYFYSLCLQYLLADSFFEFSGIAGVWLPPEEGFNVAPPSLEDIKTIDLSLLSPSLDRFLFDRLPKLVVLPREQVKWHFNPLCSGCDYRTECKSVAVEDGRLGAIPNISISDARTLHEFLSLGEQLLPGFTRSPPADIEDLPLLISKPNRMATLDKHSPVTTKKVQRILALPRRKNTDKSRISSPIVNAALSGRVKIIPRRNFTCPSREDIAIVMSLVQDPASPKPNLEYFCITVFFDGERAGSFSCNGPSEQFVPMLAATIRNVTAGLQTPPSAQFYLWSASEQTVLQVHLTKTALTSDVDRADIRLCIGALAQGASWLKTTFQPVLLSGALLSFLGKGSRTKPEYQACLERMNLPTDGSVPELRARIVHELERLQRLGNTNKTEAGRIAPVVNLKKEIERIFALPVPGYWELQECHEALVNESMSEDIPTDDQILYALRNDNNPGMIANLLSIRNEAIYDILFAMRAHIASSGLKLLVNEGKPVSREFMDMCRQEHLSKLFFMQQFEVFAKLNNLWASRIDGSPDAPIIEYQRSEHGPLDAEHIFRVVSGSVDVPSSDKDRSFFDKLLVEDIPSDSELPVESLFDDVTIGGLVIPLNKWTMAHWVRQDRRVQEEIKLADIRNVYASCGYTMVVLRTWGTTSRQLVPDQRYRLSPRLVDFNTTKVLATLFEMDWQWSDREYGPYSDAEPDHRDIPFLQLIMDPKSFGKTCDSEKLVKLENGIQRLFRHLKDLDVPAANSLFLKPSQHRATQRVLSNRLSVIWGPPGTGKTHTIALSLLRLLEVQWKLEERRPQIIFITAMTHAAIDACLGKLESLIAAYRSVESLSTDWLDKVQIQRIAKGSDHPGPSRSGDFTYFYAGTLFQLYNFSKANSFEVDCLAADEAGQIALASLSLVMRCLHPDGRIIIAGDSEQLAPILTGSYPRLKTLSLFGSVLDSLMFTPAGTMLPVTGDSQTDNEESLPPNTVVQLTENFRLNPDLGEFVSTIYSRRFKHQKVQARQLGLVLYELGQMRTASSDVGVQRAIFEEIRDFLLGLSNVMLRVPQTTLRPPKHRINDSNLNDSTSSGKLGANLSHYPVSLSLIRLKTWSTKSDQFGYETHVHAEAAIAASLIACFQYCSPEDDIFVATPHRMQREAVKSALASLKGIHRPRDSLEGAFGGMRFTGRFHNVTVDTIERLQGSEASFVICLFSLPDSHSDDLSFLLERRRLNVAISRAKALCVLVASSQVLYPPVTLFANEQAAKGFAFLKAYEKRAWSYDVSVNVDDM